MRTCLRIAIVAALVFATAPAPTARVGAPVAGPALTSVGPLTFGPNGVLLAADPMAATVYAINLDRQASGARTGTANVAGLDQKIAALLGTEPAGIRIVDMAVHPTSKNAFVAVMRGQGTDARPALVRVDGGGAVELVALDALTFTTVTLPSPAAVNPNGRGGRAQSVTDLAFSDGRVYISGLSNEEFASKLYSVAYPFVTADKGTSVEIFHGNHGRLETRSPVMAFLPMTIANQPHIVAGYTCTPLVKFPVAALNSGSQKVLGTTMAELGAGNQPLDIITYQKAGQQYLLMSNSSRGVMKIPTATFASAAHIGAPVPEGTAGVPFETVSSMTGIEQLDVLDADRSLVIARGPDGTRSLSAVALP
jgi:hypothetical protein